MYRSAAALTALIRLKCCSAVFSDFCNAIQEIEPIFQLEAQANALDESHPQKKAFLALVMYSRSVIVYSLRSGEQYVDDCLVSTRWKDDSLKIVQSAQYVFYTLL